MYKIRKAESDTIQPRFEYLQDGLLARYNFEQVKRVDMEETRLVWKYEELFISRDTKKEEVPELMEIVVLPIVDEMKDEIVDVSIQESQKDLPAEFRQEVEYWLDWLFNVE